MGLIEVVETEDFDPRETRFIKVETNVRQIEKMVRDYFGAASATRRYNRETKRFETVGGESKLLIIADERTKNLIIKATPAKLDEIAAFIKLIDEKPDIGEFDTHVIAVQYGDATEIARLLNEILRQEEGQQSRARTPARTSRTSRTTRGRTTPQRTAQPNTQAPAPEDIIVDDLYERAKKTVRIVADGRTNNLLVYANEDGLKRVNDILEKIDKPVPTNFKTFVLEHAKAEVIQPTVDQIVRGSSTSSGRGRSGPTIIVDETINALHVVAEREDMARVEQIIKDFDIEIPEDEWHYVELTNITPSEAVRIIAPFLDGSAATPRRSSRGGRRSTPTRATSTAQTIPLDESNMLIVICSEDEWEKVDRVLKIADEQALSSKPEIQFFEIVNGNPQSIASTVTQLYGNYQHPVLGRSRTFVDTLGTQVVVQGVKPALEEVDALVKALDIKVEGRPLVILPLEHAEANDVLQKVQPLMGITGGGRRGSPGTAGNTIQADAVTNSLIIQADPTTLEKVRNFITEYETKVASQTPERKAYTLKHASSRDVLNAINSFFGGRGGRGRQPTAARVSAVTVGNQVIVHAPMEKQLEVAALISELDELSDKGVTTLLVKMPGADIRSIAGRLTNAFRDQTRTQGVIARFEPDLSTETILMTCSKDVLAEAEDLLSQYKELAGELIWETTAYQLKHANASDTSRWLREQLMSLLSQQMNATVVRQIKVTADMRTNRVFINAPQIAVKQGLLLLEQYDTPVEQQPVPPMEIWTEHLPGLDVRSLASQLGRNLNELMKGRTDRLRATVTADQLTNNLIITAPTDMKPKITELVSSFAAQTADLALIQKFVDIKEADANYIATQVRNILNVRMRGRGSGVTSQINIQVDTRLNRVIINAPKVAIEEAEALIAQLDQKSTAERQLRTLALENADANTVLGILRTIFNEKIRSKTLSISVEPLTNALIVGGSKEDYDEIESWAKELDTSVAEVASEQKIIELKNANPWEVNTVLQQTFVQQRRGVRLPPGKEIKIAIIAGRSLVVTAPPEKMKEIEALAAKLDEVGKNQMVVKTYQLPGLGAQLNQFARQIQNAVNGQMQSREQRISVTALPAVDTLVVTAAERTLQDVEAAMEQFKDLYKPQKMETIALLNADANTVYQALTRVLQQKIRAGKMQLGVEGITNSLIISANEEDMTEIKEWALKFDTAAADAIVPPRIFELENANPYEVRNILQATFLGSGSARRSRGMEIRFDVVGGRSIVAKAPAEKMKEVEELINRLDEMVANKAHVRTYKVPGMGAKLNQFASQIASTVNAQVQARERRISVTAYPPADVLIVTALDDQFEMIQEAMDQFKDLYEPERIETLALENGDANAVYQALSKVLQPKIRAGKIQLSVEGMTNSLIVVANEEDLAEIREWTATFDAAAKDTQAEPQIFELKNANPWEVYNVLNATFLSRRYGGRVQPGKEIKFSIVAGRSIVVQAPPEKMEDIANLITKLDEIGDNKAQVRTYEMAGMGSKLNDFARQLQNAMNSQASGREQRVTITPYQPADTLIVMALEEQFEQVEQMMEKLKPLMDVAKSKTEFFKLEYVDAGQIVNLVRDLVQKRTAAGGKRGSQDFSVSADPRTNRLIVFAPETILPDVRAVVQELDIEVDDDDIFTIELQYADPWEVRNMINDVFGNRGSRRGQAQTEQVYVTVSNSTLIVKAPPKKLEQIQELLARIDVEDLGGMTIKTYSLKVLNAQTVAGQVQAFLRSMGGVSRRGSMQPGAFAEPTTNTLVVIAPPSRLPFIEGLITQIEALGEGETASTETYVLNYARADQAQQHVDQMLKAKVAEAEGATRGRNTQQKTVVMADTESNRLFVFAQQKYQKLAADMIKMIDQDIDTGEIVHIIRLENADATQLGQTVTQTMQSGTAGRRGTAPMKVKVVADAGSNSILLSGLPKDVAEIETLINDLEVTYDTIPELQYFELDYALAYDVAEALRNIFPPGRNQSDDVNVTEDDYYNKILVTTNRRKMRQVEAIVKQLDMAPEDDGGMIAGGKEIYFVEVYKGDPFDIAWDVSDLLPPPERGGPKIEADWFGEYIQVICRPTEFPRVERLIRQFDNKAKPEIVVRARQFLGNEEQLIQYLQERQYDFLQEKFERPKVPESIIIDLHPEADEHTNESSKPAPATSWLSGGAPRPFGGFILTTLFQDALGTQESDPPVEDEPEKEKPAQEVAFGIDDLSEPPQRQLPAIQMMPDGRLILRGPRDAVEELEDAIDLFEEDLSRGEVIRIFRFKYGDVNAASRILDMMFNTRQVRVPQQQQRPGQQGQQRGGQQGGKDGQQQDQRQSIMQQAMQMMGSRGDQQGGTTGGTQIRIATDASHNYIIVKCDEALLPDIIQLLRELDISPSEVDVQVIQLKNLEATETANNIKQVLGISGSSSSARPQQRAAGRNQEVAAARMVAAHGQVVVADAVVGPVKLGVDGVDDDLGGVVAATVIATVDPRADVARPDGR